MNTFLKEKYPYLINFFESLFNSEDKGIPNSIILYGSDILSQYIIALDIAKQANCIGTKKEDCNCINCTWINANKHPAVLTISKINNKSDNSKTVISKEQVDDIMNLLINSSEYHRFFIFCDADIKTLSDTEKANLTILESVGIKSPESNSEEQKWYPKGITKACFQEVAANSLLKSIEEPPERVTFIFLTEDKNDLIQTIISRSQAFFVPSFNKKRINTDFLNESLANYPNFSPTDALRFSTKMLEIMAINSLDATEILDSIQIYLKDMILANNENKIFIQYALKSIEKAEESKKMLLSHIKDQTVLEDFSLSLLNLNENLNRT